MTSAQHMSDAALAQAFVDRVPDALTEAYRRYGDLLYSVARSVNGGPEAEDCIHDAFVRVWSHPESYRPERGALRAFLVVCVRNEALTRRRNAARHATIEQKAALLKSDGRDAFEDIEHVDIARLRAAMAALPADQRTVLELAYDGNLSQSAIAARLGVPLGTVKSRASIALRKLALTMHPPVNEGTP
ncbi:MAG: RNA polymerase sigma factor [Candidatus Velthaea sp.]